MPSKLLHLSLLIAVAVGFSASAAGQPADGPQAARLHRNGNTAAAMAIWVPLAKAGDVNAAYNLAVIHDYGDGVAKNQAEALKWYRIAAERGDRVSQSRLGTMYLNGEGTAKDEKEGWRWINQHRVAHVHHDHHPHMVAWREQAAKLIDERDRREAVAASRRDSARVMAELKRRAGAAEVVQLAAGSDAARAN
ncbi:MAG: hypothetical protein WC540_12280 [Sulfuritalea sp.]